MHVWLLAFYHDFVMEPLQVEYRLPRFQVQFYAVVGAT